MSAQSASNAVMLMKSDMILVYCFIFAAGEIPLHLLNAIDNPSPIRDKRDVSLSESFNDSRDPYDDLFVQVGGISCIYC